MLSAPMTGLVIRLRRILPTKLTVKLRQMRVRWRFSQLC